MLLLLGKNPSTKYADYSVEDRNLVNWERRRHSRNASVSTNCSRERMGAVIPLGTMHPLGAMLSVLPTVSKKNVSSLRSSHFFRLLVHFRKGNCCCSL